MKRIVSIGLLSAAVAGTAAYAEHRHFQSTVATAIGIVDPLTVELTPSPIRKEWVLEGKPDTRSAEVARTADGSTKVVVWATTAGRFNWLYDFDEVITVLDGEVFLKDEGKPERRLGPGDVAFFPTGAKVLWRVPDHVRKIATFKPPLPGPVASVMRWVRTAKSWMRGSTAVASNNVRDL